MKFTVKCNFEIFGKKEEQSFPSKEGAEVFRYLLAKSIYIFMIRDWDEVRHIPTVGKETEMLWVKNYGSKVYELPPSYVIQSIMDSAIIITAKV